MALQADAVARQPQFGAVRLVAIAAGDARGEHFALPERRVVVGLLDVADLAVGMISGARQRLDHMRLRQRPAGHPVLVETGAGARRTSPQVSTSLRKPDGAAERRDVPLCGSIGQLTPRRSSKRTSSPLLASSRLPNGHQLFCSRAQRRAPSPGRDRSRNPR